MPQISETLPSGQPYTEALDNLTVAYEFCGGLNANGGIRQSILTVADYMSKHGARTALLIGSASGDGEIPGSFSPENVHVISGKGFSINANGAQNLFPRPVWPTAIRKLLLEVNPDLVHLAAPWAPQIGGLVLRYAQQQDRPTIATYHTYSEKPVANLGIRSGGMWDRRPIHRLDAAIAVSPVAEQHLRQYYGYRGDVHLIPNPVDVEFYASAKPFQADEPFAGFSPKERPTIVFVGRPDERKGLDTLIDTAAVLKSLDSQADAQFIICGDGPRLDEFKAYARQRGVDGQVRFLGSVSDEVKARWLATADLAAFPARGGESQGIVLIEAMAAGSGAVLGGDNAGYRSVIDELDSRELVLFNPESPVELANKALTLLRDSAARTKVHEEQQRLVRDRYDIPVIGKRITALYQSVMNK